MKSRETDLGENPYDVADAVAAEKRAEAAEYLVEEGIVYRISPGPKIPVGRSWAMNEEEIAAEYS